MGVLSSNMLSMLSAQWSHEMANHARYIARASWMRYRGLEDSGDFFEQEAGGEKEHADIVRKYIEDRNEALVPAWEAIEPLPSEYADMFVSALDIERGTTERLQAIYAAAIAEGDYMTSTWVQGMISENVEEENLYQTIIDHIAMRGVDTATVHDIDCWVKRFVK